MIQFREREKINFNKFYVTHFVMNFWRSGRISSNCTSQRTIDALIDSSTSLHPLSERKCIPNEARPCDGAIFRSRFEFGQFFFFQFKRNEYSENDLISNQWDSYRCTDSE